MNKRQYDWVKLEQALRENFGHMIDNGLFPTYQLLHNTKLLTPVKQHGGSMLISARLNCVMYKYYLSRDKHVCQSFYELMLDEYLYSRDIPHTPGVSVFGNYKCDQQIPGYYIEIWGYKNGGTKRSIEYNQTRGKKEHMYKELGIPLISIEGKVLQYMRHDEWGQFFDNIFSKLGFSVVEKRDYGIELLKNTQNYKWNLDNIKEKLYKISEEIGHLPTVHDIQKMKIHGLIEAINKFGGINQIYGKPKRQNKKMHPDGYWCDEKIIECLKVVIDRGETPSSGQLNNYVPGLLGAIENRGGLHKYLAILQSPTKHKSKNYWDSEDNIINALQSVIVKLGHFPSSCELQKIKEFGLFYAVHKKHNMNYFKQLLNY